MPNPVINRRSGGKFICPAMLVGGIQSDTLQSYTSGVALSGLAGGTGWCKIAKYADRTGYLGLLASDTLESYTNGVNLRTLNGGTGAWNTAYEADDVSVVIAALNAWPVAGTTFTMSVTASGGFPAYGYQWNQNGTPLTNTGKFSGVTTATLTITNYQNTEDATYTCSVTDTTGRAAVVSQGCVTAVATTNAQLWAAVVAQTNGGPWPSSHTVSAFDTWDAAVTTAGIKSNLYHVNLIAPDSVIAMLTPFIATYGFSYYGGHNHGGTGATVTVNGAIGNGTVYDTVDPSTIPSFTSGNMGISIYAAPPVPQNDNADIGYLSDVSGGRPSLSITPRSSFNGTGTFCNGLETGGIDILTGLTGAGGYFMMDSRTSTTSHTAYWASSTITWAALGTGNAANVTGPQSRLMGFLGNQNYEGGHWYANTTRISFYAVHDGFSSANGQALFNAVQALRVTLGGGYA